MKCEDARDHLAEYVTGQMAPEQQAEMDAHMAECKECLRVSGVAREWLTAECKDVRGALVDYALWKDRGGETPGPHEDTAGAWVGIEGHLAGCESCVRELVEARRVMRIFGDTSTTREAFSLILSMFNENASSAHIEVSELGASVKLCKHGCLVPYCVEFDVAAAELLLARLRRMMSVSLVEDGTGTTSVRTTNAEFTVSGSFFQTEQGQAAVLKLAESPPDVRLDDTGA